MPQDYYITFSKGQWPVGPTGRILILDSSFNPPTEAHTALLMTAMRSFPEDFFDASLLLFTMHNVDKQLTGASVKERTQMMEIFARHLAGNEKSFSTIAVGLTTYGRFIDKMRCIANQQEELYFILGYDTITRLFNPEYYDIPLHKALKPFFDFCHIICADRPGECNQPNTVEAFWKGDVSLYRDKIKRIQLPESVMNVSSTLARNKIREGAQDIDGIISRDVAKFVRDNGLYLYE